MDDWADSRYRSIEAPYVADAGRLLRAAADAPYKAFYRMDSTDGTRDLFSAGSFEVYEFPWNGVEPFRWETLLDNYNEIDFKNGPVIGYFGYEAGFGFELEKWGELRRPASGYAWRLIQLPCWYMADHETHSARIWATHNAEPDAIEYLSHVAGKGDVPGDIRSVESGDLSIHEVAKRGELSREQYEKRIREILTDIGNGRYYELNFTQRFHELSRRAPADVFAGLLQKLSPRRACYLDFGDEVIGSASPELFLRKAGDHISTRPIKGSMMENTSDSEREKLYAEHIMVVDLARNDLGRVSDLGWVQVDEMATVSAFGGLHHLESLVSGRTSFSLKDILARTFPAASITGVPKVMVVQAISEYEASARGIYTGSCGCIWPDGDFDLNVAIRTFTATVQGDCWRYEIGAGGAIVADSEPGAEYIECLRKAQPLLTEVVCNE